MSKKPVIWFGYSLLLSAGLYVAAKITSMAVVVVSLSGTPEGSLEFAGTRITYGAETRYVIAPLVISTDSHFVLRCDGSETPFGYLTKGLDLLILVEIDSCKVRSITGFL